MNNAMMRKATSADLEAIAAIYNDAIGEGGFTGDLEPLSLENRRAWFADHRDRYAIFVKVLEGAVIGYVALSPYRKGRRAFERTCEISYYLAGKFRGLGFGGEMLDYALSRAKDSGFRTVVAILLSTNRRSIALLSKFGFSVSGVIPQAAEINGDAAGHMYLHRILGDPQR
jgi:L-amino acid N-acyltransferase YncA